MAEIKFSYLIPPKSIGEWVIDCVLNEHYSFGNSVTEIPIEDGSVVSDHVRENSDEIQIKAFIGNTEFIEIKSQADLPDAAPGDPKGRIRAAYQELLRLKRERQPVDVVLGLDTFHDMIITTFDIDRDVATGANLPFDMSFKNIKIVKSEKTTINSSTAPAGDQTAGIAHMGTAGTNKVDPASDRAKEEWRQSVEEGMTPKWAYEEKWGVPYPQ
ncbi:hypothetical protein AGMMS49944_31510 [Spirochaetia bacterium]|nr:hypothetical protein AGMMS49944_31510 [Spirochaetia bacterium]